MFHDLVHNKFAKTIKAWLLCFLGKMGRFVPLESFAGDHPNRVRFISRGKEQTIYSRPRIDLSDNKELREVGLVESFVVLIKDACCFAYSDLIMLEEKVYYCEIKEDPIIGSSSNCSDKYVLLSDEKSYYTVVIPAEKKKIDSGIFMSGIFSWNYYHFSFQVLPKLQMVEEIESSVPLLVDKKVTEIPSFAVLLSVCNKLNRPVEVMEEKVRYCVDNLYYVSAQTYLEPGHKIGTPYPKFACRYRPSVLNFLRETMIPRAKHTVYPKRIFVGRKYASGRRPFNEEDCISCAKEYGFEVVFPEFMTLEEQIGLFNNAEIIMGGSGAAFTNLIYCSKGVKVIVLYKFGPTLGIWQTIVDFIGGDLVHVCETAKVNRNPKNDHDSFCINVDKLREVLDAM